eukprot:TRINITY_DN2237_c0_g2_i6.p1 TRINITY_DN2237_c0_g2~~TRINITY_DN2237_c0_g2_i6.p1  ORF type:complete len:585 (+),score=48.40 TRINITY_DN2237_c0_g2_i6:1627-3381(+)
MLAKDILPLNTSSTYNITIGSTTKPSDKEGFVTWSIFVLDPAHIVSYVEFKLHPTFSPPSVTVYQRPFELKREGWGEFDITVVVRFIDNTENQYVHSLDFTKQLTQKDVAVHIPIKEKYEFVIGQSSVPVEDGLYDWTLYVNGETNVIEQVNFVLHPTFSPPEVILNKPSNFAITRRGWGGFDIKVIIKFIDGKIKEYTHALDLEKTREEKNYHVTISPPEVFKVHITDMHSDWVNQGGHGSHVLTFRYENTSECNLDIIDWNMWKTNANKVGVDIVNGIIKNGFIFIKNHPIPDSIIKSTMKHSKRFFELKRKAAKEELARIKAYERNYHHFAVKTTRGYSDIREESLNPNNGQDLKESFDYALPLSETGVTYLGSNKWPTEGSGAMADKGFKDKALGYLTSSHSFAKDLLHAICMGLGLKANEMDKYFKDPLLINRLLKYPPQDDMEPLSSPFEMGAGSHVDFGALTIIHQDQKGLEIMDDNLNWRQIPNISGTMIINVGYVMEKLTNGRLKATKHRVINRSTSQRFSIATFFDPNPNVKVGPLEQFINEDFPKKFEPCVVGHKGVMYYQSEGLTQNNLLLM